jgi:hypothetical protein
VSALPPEADVKTVFGHVSSGPFRTHAAQNDLLGESPNVPNHTLARHIEKLRSKVAAADQRFAQSSIAATASISISHPARIRRLTTRNVLAGGLATLR